MSAMSRDFTERTRGRVHDIKIKTALEVGGISWIRLWILGASIKDSVKIFQKYLGEDSRVLGMPGPCEHEK